VEESILESRSHNFFSCCSTTSLTNPLLSVSTDLPLWKNNESVIPETRTSQPEQNPQVPQNLTTVNQRQQQVSPQGSLNFQKTDYRFPTRSQQSSSYNVGSSSIKKQGTIEQNRNENQQSSQVEQVVNNQSKNKYTTHQGKVSQTQDGGAGQKSENLNSTPIKSEKIVLEKSYSGETYNHNRFSRPEYTKSSTEIPQNRQTYRQTTIRSLLQPLTIPPDHQVPDQNRPNYLHKNRYNTQNQPSFDQNRPMVVDQTRPISESSNPGNFQGSYNKNRPMIVDQNRPIFNKQNRPETDIHETKYQPDFQHAQEVHNQNRPSNKPDQNRPKPNYNPEAIDFPGDQYRPFDFKISVGGRPTTTTPRSRTTRPWFTTTSRRPEELVESNPPPTTEKSKGSEDVTNNETVGPLEGTVWEDKTLAGDGFGVLKSRCTSYSPGLVPDGAGGCTKQANRIKKK